MAINCDYDNDNYHAAMSDNDYHDESVDSDGNESQKSSISFRQ